MSVKWKTDEEFWRAAARSAGVRYRFFKWSLTIEQIDAEIALNPDWMELKKTLKPGDLIWPFEFNQNTLAYRKGFVVIRNRTPIGGIVTLVS